VTESLNLSPLNPDPDPLDPDRPLSKRELSGRKPDKYKGFVSPFEFRKHQGTWQRRLIGTTTWTTLVLRDESRTVRIDWRQNGETAYKRWDWI